MDLSERDILRLRKVVQNTGKQAFVPAFRNLFRAHMRFGTFLVMRFDPGRAPVLLDAWILPTRLPTQALSEYLETTYPFDPFYQFADTPPEGGFYRLPEIAPDRFFSSEYYLEYYLKTGLIDEVGMLVPLANGARAHLSMSRFPEMGRYRRREIACLKHHAPLLLELLGQHVAASSPGIAPSADLPPLEELIRAHTRDTLGCEITRREAQVAALVLQGHSNGSAALTLDVSRETCKVHRRNLYRKLAISSQRELFGLLKHLL